MTHPSPTIRIGLTGILSTAELTMGSSLAAANPTTR